MKQGKNHVSWNENPPQTAADAVAGAKERAERQESGIDSPPQINKTAAVTTNAEYEEMKKKLERLKEEERTVDRYLDYLKEQAAAFNGHQPPTREQLEALPHGIRSINEHMYVRFKDITSMPQYRSDTVIGIRAPTGTSLEVTDPEQARTMGQRPYEIFLSSKGAPGPSGKPEGKGEPINVYLVQPRAEQEKQGGGARTGASGTFVTPTSQRTADGSHVTRKENAPQQPDAAGSQPPGYASMPSRRHEDPHQPRGGEWGYGPGRPPHPSHGRSFRKENAPPPGPPGMMYPDGSWGPPPPHGGYGPPPPGYYPRGPPRSSQHHTPETKKPGSVKERSDLDDPRAGRREDEMYSQSRYPHPPASHPESGSGQMERGNPFRPRQHQYQTPHELGRTASAGEGSHRDAAGQFRPPSPSSQQQNLLNMPLQSPSETNYFPSPSAMTAFSPPGGGRANVRSSDVQFPIPPMPREGREYRERWRPPQQKMKSAPRHDDSPPEHGPPHSHRS